MSYMSNNNGHTVSVRERFFKQIEGKQDVVDVTAPSGAIYKFRRPSRFGILFKVGHLPQSAASEAADSWREQGVIKEGEETAIETANDAEKMRVALLMRDKVLAMSVEPKLVVGAARADNEVSTDEVPDDDLDYLFKWVASGGDTSLMLNTFPEGRKPDTLASANRPKNGNQAKSAGGDS
jgi:hypothetical protein